jgi:hypothetical protein
MEDHFSGGRPAAANGFPPLSRRAYKVDVSKIARFIGDWVANSPIGDEKSITPTVWAKYKAFEINYM